MGTRSRSWRRCPVHTPGRERGPRVRAVQPCERPRALGPRARGTAAPCPTREGTRRRRHATARPDGHGHPHRSRRAHRPRDDRETPGRHRDVAYGRRYRVALPDLLAAPRARASPPAPNPEVEVRRGRRRRLRGHPRRSVERPAAPGLPGQDREEPARAGPRLRRSRHGCRRRHRGAGAGAGRRRRSAARGEGCRRSNDERRAARQPRGERTGTRTDVQQQPSRAPSSCGTGLLGRGERRAAS